MGRLILKAEDWKQITDAICSSFDTGELSRLVRVQFPNLHVQVSWHNPLVAVVHDVVDTANRFGILDQLLVAISAERPERPDLAVLALRPGGVEVVSGLELLTTRGDPFMDTTRLASFLIRAERQVCQVRCGVDHGTGFLVAADLLLTCYHVVKGHLEEGFAADAVRVRFDYRAAANGTVPPYDSGEWLPIDASWSIPRSRWSQADISHVGLPAADELDFALLRLARRVALEAPVGETTPRGWVDLSTDPPLPPQQAPVLIVQHPKNGAPHPPQQPLKVTIAPGFEGANANGTRLRYTPSTLQGSSGSPVFGPDYRAVALHHNHGDASHEAGLARNNRGIPLAKIRAALTPDVRALLIPPPPQG